jgi:hypothetical protein
MNYKVQNYLPLKSAFGQVLFTRANEPSVSKKPSFFRIFQRFIMCIFYFKIYPDPAMAQQAGGGSLSVAKTNQKPY